MGFRQFLIQAFVHLAIALSAQAQNSVALPIYPQFNELKKITVGPDDQLDASVDSQQKFLVFTHRANMISHLRIQELSTGEVRDLLPSDADSVQAKFNERGQIVFVYFKQSARGDICYTDAVDRINDFPLKAGKIHCLPRIESVARTERSQPFWLGNDRIGFLEKNETKVNLVSVLLGKESEISVIASSSSLLAPNATMDGRFLVFTQLVRSESHLVLLDRAAGEKLTVPIDLPGNTGFASLSAKGDYVYFSHFMGDSNQDTIIDGNDNSVVWRVSVQSLLASAKRQDGAPKELGLEQLTPMDFNCSFPVAMSDQLYLTCAFEGSLDIYSLPSEGIVPRGWNEQTIENAYQSARSYQDRILLINNLKFRSLDSDKTKVLNERLFNLHLLADEVSAALFYANGVSAVESLKVFLTARRLNKNQPLKAKTFLFKEQIQKLERELQRVKGEEIYKPFIRAYLLALRGQKSDLNSLGRLLTEQSRPIQFWLYYCVAEEMYPKEKTQLASWINVLKVMSYNKVLTLESRIYYAFELLQLLESIDLDVRKQTLVAFANGLNESSEIRALLNAEIHILELILGADKKEKMLALQKIYQLMMKYKSQYFVRKAINVRAVLNFLMHQQFQQLNAIAANWIRDTPATSTEFSYARDVVIAAAREQAYGYWTKSGPRLAADYFFQSLSLTDDLESYAGYVNTMTEVGQRPQMEERLAYLQKHNVMKDGVHFVAALLSLQESEESQRLDKAIQELQSLRADLVDPLRTLLLGYVYLEKFRQSKNGVEYDRELWKKAHQNLILTADLARGRRRVRAAALTNLGVLHLWGQNFGQSVRFFELRKQLGFEGPQMDHERLAFAWFYSQALFLAGQFKQAATEIMELPEHQLTTEFLERKAFYLSMSGQYSEALVAYEKVQKSKGTHFDSLSEPSRTKVRLGMAYTLFKAQRHEMAKALFQKIARESPGAFKAQEGIRQLDFNPHEIETIAWGFLAQMGTDDEMRPALEARIKRLAKDNLPSSMQAKMRLAEVISKTDPRKAAEYMQEALVDCRSFTAENGHLGQSVFRTLTNYLVHALLFESEYKGRKHNELMAQWNRTLDALKRQTEVASVPIRLEQWRLQYLGFLFQERILGESPGSHWREELNKSSLSEKLRLENPKAFAEVQQQVQQLE